MQALTDAGQKGHLDIAKSMLADVLQVGVHSTRSTLLCYAPTHGLEPITKEIQMTLVKKSINGTEYYTDDDVFYTFHQVHVAADTLWNFACMELGITKKTGFNSQETKNITDLAGIGPLRPTMFLLLKNGNAIPVPYLANGSSNLHPNDIVLRLVSDPALPEPSNPSVTPIIPPSVSTKSVADRLKEIEDLHDRKLLTNQEYQDKRANIIAEL